MSHWRTFCFVFILSVIITGVWDQSLAKEVLAGPIPARVIRVIDGDTLEVEARIWLGQAMRIKVRLYGLDTPEKRSRYQAERRAARAATVYLGERITRSQVNLSNIHYGKYAGRVMARVHNLTGSDLTQAMISAGHGRRYGGGKRQPWCDTTGALLP